jgi:Tol biopolymer transport system component
LLVSRQLQAQQPPAEAGVQLEAGIEKEEVIGDLKSAMEIYQRIAADNLASRDVRARALLRLAGCDEKLGRPAKQLYEQIVRDFGDQPAAAQARKRLAVLAQQQRPPPLAAMSERRIEWSRLGSMGPGDTDGERAVYASGDNLYFGDLAGRSKRLTVATRRFSWVPCRDFSLVLLDLLSTPTRQHTLAVIKPDGAGYRTLIRDDAKNSIFQQDQPFAMSCSWDDRNVLLSDFSLKSTISGQLWIVSVADGRRRVLVDEKGWRIRKAVFSPDGRFAAYEVWPIDPASPHTSRVFIVPLNVTLPAGEPRLAYESAPWQVGNAFFSLMDWTADGRSLVLHDVRQGKSALYLLPVKDGTATGPAAFVRFGNFDDGYTTASGGLVYEDRDASPSSVDAALASIDADDRLGEWQPIDLNTSGASNPWPSFSPDGTQILYTARDADPSRRNVILRDLSTGQEREIYRSSYGSTVCLFSGGGPTIFCGIEKEKGETELISVSVDSGAVERIATLPGSRFLLATSRDGQTFFFSGNAWLLGANEPPLFRWDRATGQETTMEPASQDQRLISVSADGQWIARLLDGTVSIRPSAGGDWKPLASGVTIKLPPVFLPDGRWLLYQTVDSTGRGGVFRVPLTGGNSERLGDLPNNGSPGTFVFSPDGRKVIAVAEKPADYGLSLLENFVPPIKK